MKMKTNYILSIIGAIILTMVSCDRTDEKLDIISNYNINGEWQVAAYVDNEPVSDDFQIDILKYSSDSIAINESGFNFWGFSTKAAFAESIGKFQTDLSICLNSEDEEIGISISNGRIIAPDSISFEIKFEDDEIPFGTNYELRGHRLK